ncbi:MAG: DUF2252 domain-containing protein [Solirubrobacterales bacterium]|jgi:uncharacterized protein (DUF2252 family)
MERLIGPATIALMATKSSHSSDAPKRRPRAAAAKQPAPVTHLSVQERIARGKAARQEVPRSLHAHFEPSEVRADPVELLERQAETRVPELVPIRYGRMLVSPFTFYRGAAMIMAHDLAATPRSGLIVQCCGDAHLSNFGAFASPERRLVFDINDFDETLPGPWEWDVKRLAASMLIAANDNGYGAKDRDKIVLETVGAYRNAVREFAGMGNLAVWYAHLDIESAVGQYSKQFKAGVVSRAEKALAKAHTRDSMSAFKKLTEVVDGKVQIVDQSPLIVPIEKLVQVDDIDALFDELRMLIRVYRESLEFDRRVLIEEFRLQDFARKVVGVGSVGTRAWIGLMMGRDGSDPLFLQIKEAEASVLEPFLGASEFANHGQRVVTGQRLMQAVSDIFLGWVHNPEGLDGKGRDFYVRQLKDWKASAEIEQMVPEGMKVYGRLCGWTLARAHARSGDRIAIASYLGGGDTFDRAILEFSKAYAAQNDSDYKELAKAVKSGRIKAQTGL